MKMKRTSLSIDSIVIFAYFLNLLRSILKCTMFKVYIPDYLFSIMRVVSLLIFIVIIVGYRKFSIRQIIYIYILLVCFLLTCKASTDFILIEILITCLAMKGISFNKVVKCFYLTSSTLIFVTFISSLLGIIENRIFYRTGTDIIRYSFGAVYPTDFAALIFFMLISFGYLKYRTFTWKYFFSYVLIGLFLFEFCNTRIDSIGIIFAGFIFWILSHVETWKCFERLKNILPYIMSLCSIIIIYLTLTYNNQSQIYLLLDKFFSSRLKLGWRAFNLYGLNLFGNKIEMQGWGVLDFDYSKGYFFLDSSYINILFRLGIVSLIIILIIFIIKTKIILKRGNNIIPICLALIAINSMIAHHLLGIAYNPFLFIFLVNIEDNLDRKSILMVK